MQAILILAHNNIPQLARLAELLHKDFLVYIHIDAKYSLTDEERRLLTMENVEFYQEVTVNWGSWSIGQGGYSLIKKALANPDIEYVHLISGLDWPILSPSEIYDRFDGDDKMYIRIEPAAGVKKSHEPLLWWQRFYFNYDKVNRRTAFGKIYHRFIIAAQLILGVNKYKKYGIDLTIYQGCNWMDAPRYMLEYLIEYYDSHENIRKLFATGYCPDEFWVQTILGNSPYAEKIVNKELRFVKWEQRYGSYPAILDISDIEEVKNSGCVFMRKVTEEHSKPLMDGIFEK